MNKQVTAVEWLIERYFASNEPFDYKHLEQAKAMEKQQIIDACNLQRNDYKSIINDYRGMPTYNKSAEQYYNETIKSKQ